MSETRISINNSICHGKPHIKDTRIMVQKVLNLLAASATFEEIISEDFPDLTVEDIRACITYTNNPLQNEEVLI